MMREASGWGHQLRSIAALEGISLAISDDGVDVANVYHRVHRPIRLVDLCGLLNVPCNPVLQAANAVGLGRTVENGRCVVTAIVARDAPVSTLKIELGAIDGKGSVSPLPLPERKLLTAFQEQLARSQGWQTALDGVSIRLSSNAVSMVGYFSMVQESSA
jgi:hypothetical protein